jgi:UDP-N-acetylglucosamine/UDP-N-acetylgalactosamine diphosphorylase
VNQSDLALHTKLESLGQTHLLRFWEELTDEEKKAFSSQVESLDEEVFHRLKSHLIQKKEQDTKSIRPPKNILELDGIETSTGQEALKKGKIGVVLLAGGQASRLRLEGPKGCVPVTPVEEKTLFAYFAQKIAAAQKLWGLQIHVAVMTSPLNHQESVDYFRRNSFFGLEKLTFFEQEVYPLFDGHFFMFLENKYKIAVGPNGNGSFFRQFSNSGLLQKWKGEGIEHIQLLPVDNPLFNPLGVKEISAHLQSGNEVTLYGDYIRSNNEKVGTIVSFEKSLTVIDYMEREESQLEGDLLGNLGIYLFSLEYLERVSNEPLPLHLVNKIAPQLFDNQTLRPSEPNAWKFETFLFDAFVHSQKCGALHVSREEMFAPLKNSQGTDSIDTVQRALYLKDCGLLKKEYCVEHLPSFPFELHPQFYYLSKEQKEMLSKENLFTKQYVEVPQCK